MKESWLPQGGVNLFQEIKEKCNKAEMSGQKLYRLSIGQPAGPALFSARESASQAILSDLESMHEYQDNGSPGIPNFAERFVNAHFEKKIKGRDIAYLPIPGIKPMLGLIPLACGAADHIITVATTTNPGYPTPADWCNYLSIVQYPLLLHPENHFRFLPTEESILPGTNLIMTNYPHNPSGQIATKEWWRIICDYCEENKIRLFNDNPYYILSHSSESCALAEVAVDFPDLSWAEAFSASKVIGNGTGWRVGAMVGSSDFIGDIATIKGNTDSGFVAPMAVGVLHAIENDYKGIRAQRDVYGRRLMILIEVLTRHGMRLAVRPGAGFFSLWDVPKKAFGQEIVNAKQFNFLMIEKTGIVGVHFDPYIRYAVCGDVESMISEIEAGFIDASVSY